MFITQGDELAWNTRFFKYFANFAYELFFKKKEIGDSLAFSLSLCARSIYGI